VHNGDSSLNTIGLSTAALYPIPTEDTLITIAELGFPAVEVFLQADEEHTPGFGRMLDRRRRDLGLRVHSIHLHSFYFNLWSPYSRTVQETRARFHRTLDLANRIEARAITWHGLHYGIDNSQLIRDFFESTAWAGEQAQAAGIVLCIENVSWCYLRTSQHVAAIRQAGLPVGFTFDAFQAGESDIDPADLIHAMDSRLTTVHLSDYAPNRPRHLPPGQGVLDWPAILRALQNVSYGGPLIIETAHVSEPATFLRARQFVEQVSTDVARSDR
jgi:sugar phosphate isomerase/epimerase